MIEQLLITGLVGGAVYALLALSLVIVYTGTGVVNFLQGSFVMIGSYLTVLLLGDHGWPVPLAVLGAVCVTALLAGLVERMVIRRTFAIGELQAVVATVALLVIAGNLVRMIWGPHNQRFPRFLPDGNVGILGANISIANLTIFATSMVLVVAAVLFIRYTRIGLMMRATADNPRGAEVVGVRVDRVRQATWLLAGSLGAMSGVLLGHVVPTTPEMGIGIMIKGFAAAILGGFISIPGAIIGALALGVVENFGAFYINSVLKDGFSFATIILVLLLRPEGFFSRAKARHV